MVKKTNRMKKTSKRKSTSKRKRTSKKKHTAKKKGGGKTPYSRRREPCRYGEACRRTNPQHFRDFTHPTQYEEIKTFIQACADSYEKGTDVFAHLPHGSVQFLKEGLDTNVQRSFFFHLLTYMVCNICPLVKAYGQAFLSTMLQRFNEESVDIAVDKKDVEAKVQACMTDLGIDHINSIALLNALTNPDSAFNQMGCAS
jgi:hypothetical protein